MVQFAANCAKHLVDFFKIADPTHFRIRLAAERNLGIEAMTVHTPVRFAGAFERMRGVKPKLLCNFNHRPIQWLAY